MPLLGTGRTGIEELLLFLILAGGVGRDRTGIDGLLLFLLLSGMTGRGLW